VDYSESGEPRSVKYHLLSSMLLNELQKQQRMNQEQDREIRELRAKVDEMNELKTRLAQIENAVYDAAAAGTQIRSKTAKRVDAACAGTSTIATVDDPPNGVDTCTRSGPMASTLSVAMTSPPAP
jgi:hypothetical protein